MNKINENTKVTLTFEQLKKLVKESSNSDKKVRELVLKIAKDSKEWADFVVDGNEDAYTDSLIESIVETAKQLGVVHGSRFD